MLKFGCTADVVLRMQLLETAEKAISDVDARTRLLDGIKDSTVDFLLEYLPHIEVRLYPRVCKCTRCCCPFFSAEGRQTASKLAFRGLWKVVDTLIFSRPCPTPRCSGR